MAHASGDAASRNRRSLLRRFAVLVVVLGAAGTGVWWRMRPLPVIATPVVRGKAIDAVYATGTVEAENRVHIKAKTSGSIAEVLVKEGARVKRGDLLARIDNPAVTFDLKRGKADLSAASAQAGESAPQIAALRAQAQAIQAEIDNARAERARTEKLTASGSVADAELERARARVAQLEGTLAANEAQQRALRIDLSANAQRQAAAVQSLASRVTDTEVRSPLDGVVLAKSIEIGEVVTINQTLFKVGDTRSLILEVAIDEADVARVHEGPAENAPAQDTPSKPAAAPAQAASLAAVSLYAFPKEVFRGRVFELLPDANRERKSFLAKVRLDEPPAGLRSGMSAEVNIIAAEHDGVLLAPSEAESNGSVWLIQGDRVEARRVEVGIRDLLRVEVLSGLAEGDLLVVEGGDKLQVGKRVSITVRQPDKLAPLPDKSQPARTSL